VFGAWAALRLQRSGRQVLLIDAHGPGNSRSSSGDESRIIRMGYGTDEIYTRSAVRSLQSWRDLFERTGEPLFCRTGVLWLAHEDDPYPSRTIETLERTGVECERLALSEIGRRYPQFALDKISWAVLEPQSGVLLARRAVQAVVREAIRAGAEYLQDAVRPPDGGAKRLDHIQTVKRQSISAENFIFACGSWLPKLFPDLLEQRIRPTRQEVFYFGTPAGDDRFMPPALPTWIDFPDEAYGLPDIEDRGIKCAIDRHGEPFDPDTGERVASSEGLDAARKYLARRVPALKDAPLVESRVCQYENTSQGDFLIDRHPQFENVWLAGGGSGHGFKHGPMVGEYVADRLSGQSEGLEPRFALDSKGTAPSREVY
jgi:glycine/D-amino acid oxidase-like deaminating enzyme